MKLLDFVLQEIHKQGYEEKEVKELQAKYKMKIYRKDELITNSFEVFKAIAPSEVKKYIDQQIKMLRMTEKLKVMESK